MQNGEIDKDRVQEFKEGLFTALTGVSVVAGGLGAFPEPATTAAGATLGVLQAAGWLAAAFVDAIIIIEDWGTGGAPEEGAEVGYYSLSREPFDDIENPLASELIVSCERLVFHSRLFYSSVRALQSAGRDGDKALARYQLKIAMAEQAALKTAIRVHSARTRHFADALAGTDIAKFEVSGHDLQRLNEEMLADGNWPSFERPAAEQLGISSWETNLAIAEVGKARAVDPDLILELYPLLKIYSRRMAKFRKFNFINESRFRELIKRL